MAEFTVRPMPGEGDKGVIRHHWSDEKRCRSLSLTQDSWKILGALANDCGNRSEVVEIITRYAYNANLDLSSIRTELLNPEAAAKAGLSTAPKPAAEQPDTFGVDACEFKPPAIEVDFDTPVQCSI